MRKKLFAMLFLSCALAACASQTPKTLLFGNAITYSLPINFNEIQKNGDFLVITGKGGEKMVVSENFLDPVLNQMGHKTSGLDFFNYIYEHDIMGDDAPIQISEFKNGFLDGPFIKKYKKTKKWSACTAIP